MFRGADRLCIRFLNVGEGDATLIESFSGGHVFRMLVDVGEADIKHTQMRMSCADHMRRLGISRLNLVVITHLHKDHAGGLNELRKVVHIDRILSAYIPEGTLPLTAPEGAPKTVCGMVDCVNRWIADWKKLGKAQRTVLTQSANGVLLNRGLLADFAIENPDWPQFQKDVWEKMRSGHFVSESDMIAASKLRNPASIRMLLQYAGRRIELSADCYGVLWEKHAEPCDILKVPHHGDQKSVTPELAERLKPEYAVITCSDKYVAKKDRPSANAIALLRNQGAKVYFTDAFAEPDAKPEYHAEVAFFIDETGAIHAPEGNRT